jgi:glycosyltransferase involved in cell wall biosynthesis
MRGRSTELLQVRGVVDAPTESEFWRPLLVDFRGWALDGLGPPASVDIVVGGQRWHRAQLGLSRPDVPVNLNEPEASSDCGWSCTVDLAAWADLEVSVRVVATGRRGEGATIFDRILRLVESGVLLDSPADSEVISDGLLTVRGLALVEGRYPSRVDIEVDGRVAGRARLRLPQFGVESLNGRFGPFAGFEYSETLDARPGEMHEVVVTASGGDGTSVRTKPRSVRFSPSTTGAAEAAWGRVFRSRTQHALQTVRGWPEPSGSRLVVFTHQLSLGGGQLYLQELLRQLVPTLDSCTVVSPSDGMLRSELEHLGIDVIVSGRTPPRDAVTYEGQVRELSMIIRGTGAGIVLVNTLTELPAADAAERLGVPTVWAIHESYTVEAWLNVFYGQCGWDPYIRDRMRICLAEATRLVFEARTTSEIFAEYADPDRRLVIPYGVQVEAVDEFASTFDRDTARRMRDIPPQETVLLAVGQPDDKRKSIPGLVEAFAEAVSDHQDVMLVLVGNAPKSYSDALQELADAAGAGSRLRLVPTTTDIWDWYALSDVLVSASDIESLPRSMLEAMAFRVPVLSADVFGIPELIHDGDNGWLFAPRDMDTLVVAIRRLLALTPDARKAAGDRARDTVLGAHWPWNYGHSYAELFRVLTPAAHADRRPSPQTTSASVADLQDPDALPPDMDAGIREIYEDVRPFTMTSPARVMALCNAVRYIVQNRVEGDIVECGVWRGGSMLAAARTLLECGDTERALWLYDTYTGMPAPSNVDRRIEDGAPASALLAASGKTADIWAVSTLDEVKRTMALCDYPAGRIQYVAGRVEDTIPTTAPDRIALLRLDTDWYESTHHELVHLLPRVSRDGVLIIDDYGHWDGARRAVDEYVKATQTRLLLNRIDYTGRIAVVPR